MKEAIAHKSEEWFRDWFDADYESLYHHRTDEEAEAFVDIWPVDWENLTGLKALDVCSGNGRFSVAMARRDLKVFGVDLSRYLLKKASSRINTDRQCNFVRADVRALPFKGQFHLIVSMFTSFGYFDKDSEHQALLNKLGELLAPGGTLVLDLPNPGNSIEFCLRSAHTSRRFGEKIFDERRYVTEGGKRIEKELIITDKSRVSHHRESVRLFQPDEIDRMTEKAGISRFVDYWGDYQGNRIDDQLPRMVYFGMKNG